MDPDERRWRLAGQVLDAVGQGDHDLVVDLIAPLDVAQLRSLVTVLAAQVDQALPAADATGPAAVCDLAIGAAARLFDTTAEAILSAERTRIVSDARAVAMTAARSTGLSIPAIAELFAKDHGSVVHAIRRTGDRPRLDAAAATIGEHLNRRYAERLPRTGQEADTVAVPDSDRVSTFEPTNQVEHAVVAAAAAFDTTPERIVGPDRSRLACDARAVAMTAARLHGHSLPQIAAHFDRDHTAVLHATRRIDKTPPLKALAASIADQLPQDPATNGQDQPSLGGAQAVQAIERYSPPEPHPREDNHMKPLPRASTRALRQAAAGYGPLPALLLTVLLSGACGTDAESAEPALTSGDKQICYAAIRRDAMAVLSNTGSGDTDALVEIAAAVVVGSSEEEDELTMQRVETFCRDHGYNLEIPVRDQIGH